MSRPRVLHVIAVYNGRAFVPRAILSALAMSEEVAEIDVLVLDDASPEPGFSAEIERFCAAHGARYYLAPRNLGIPRNVSLGMEIAVRKGYDYVVVNNSDVIFPVNLIDRMLACFATEKKLGSLTAWSNNVSIYSTPNADPDRWLADRSAVDFASRVLSQRFGSRVLDIPAGISFCIMMPTAVVDDVGLMDPIFGRGYCEETDWSLRSLEKGYRIGLCLGTFVYHMGRGSNLAAGLVSGAHTTVPENEAVIDDRYPAFRSQVAAFEAEGEMAKLKQEAVRAVIDEATRVHGYALLAGWLDAPPLDDGVVRVVVAPPQERATIEFFWRGFKSSIALTTRDLDGQIARLRALSPAVADTFAPA